MYIYIELYILGIFHNPRTGNPVLIQLTQLTQLTQHRNDRTDSGLFMTKRYQIWYEKTTDHNLYLRLSFLKWPFKNHWSIEPKKNGETANPKPQIDRFYRAMLDPKKTPLSLRRRKGDFLAQCLGRKNIRLPWKVEISWDFGTMTLQRSSKHVQSELFLSRFAWSILVAADRLRTLGRSASFEQPALLWVPHSLDLGERLPLWLIYMVNIWLMYG